MHDRYAESSATIVPDQMNPATARSTKQWQALDSAHYLHPFTDHAALSRKGARVIVRADNIYLYDSEGRRLLDGMAGLWCMNLGYGRLSRRFCSA